jgi:hypothetical protein
LERTLCHHLEKHSVNAVFTGDLGVKRNSNDVAPGDSHNSAISKRSNHSCAGPDRSDLRGPNERNLEGWPRHPLNSHGSFERINLSAKRIAANSHIQTPEVLLACDGVLDVMSHHDEASAGAEHWQSRGDRFPERLRHPEDAGEFVHHAGFPARNHQTVYTLQMGRKTDFDNLTAKLPQDGTVLAHITLKCENPNSWGVTTSHVQRDGEVLEDR